MPFIFIDLQNVKIGLFYKRYQRKSRKHVIYLQCHEARLFQLSRRDAQQLENFFHPFQKLFVFHT